MRKTCYRCFWPEAHCWCGSIRPMETRTRFVFLMHPKEWKEEKAATGRLTHLCLPNSRIIVGVHFDENEELQAVLRDPENFPVLLYPARDAINLSAREEANDSADDDAPVGRLRAALQTRRLVVLVVDATWALGRKMLRLSPGLCRLPRVMFTPVAASRYIIKQQPHPACLSTLEAVHETLVALNAAGLDAYPDPTQLLALFGRMQEFQLQCAKDPTRGGYRRRAYSAPSERTAPRGRSGARRANVFLQPGQPTSVARGCGSGDHPAA